MIMTFRAPILALGACLFLALDGRVVLAQVRTNNVERNQLVAVLSHCGLSHSKHYRRLLVDLIPSLTSAPT
jgi:hypothetical protein